MNLNLGYTQELIKACKDAKMLRNQAAYVLATSYHETAHTMKPVVESYWLSEDWRKRNLRYYPWYGRGFVQITWEANYKRAEQEIGAAFTKDPSLALKPDLAAKIAVLGMAEGWFTGKKLGDYITTQKSDFVNARRIINGTDKAAIIAGYAHEYDNDLKDIWD